MRNASGAGGNTGGLLFFMLFEEVRESRRLPIRLLVLGRTVAEQGLHHHQQCNFLSLYTSGYAPGRTIAEQGLHHHQQCNFLSLYTSGYAPGSIVLVYDFS
ncbi:hypothetical protein Taro_031540 [Colocasia esculenta]|uniref:Uncharacterized protein n=1 Tax=Colocasia esculenta TaxID=4460 RepID=A0A843W3F0_COLES|nr:hypothetical protein [Colocasia esculenta]